MQLFVLTKLTKKGLLQARFFCETLCLIYTQLLSAAIHQAIERCEEDGEKDLVMVLLKTKEIFPATELLLMTLPPSKPTTPYADEMRGQELCVICEFMKLLPPHLLSNSDITEDCPYWEKEMGIYFFQSLKSEILLSVSHFSNL